MHERRGKARQENRQEDDIAEWTCLKMGEALGKAENKEGWRKVVARSYLVPQRLSKQRDKLVSK